MDTQEKAQGQDSSLGPKQKSKFSFNIFLPLLKNIFASTQNIIGIDIGSNYVKIAQLQKTGKGYVITNCLTRAFPLTIKDNPADKTRLVKEFVKQFLADTRIKTKIGRLAISGKGVFVLSLTVPFLKQKDLRGVVSLELKKRLPAQSDISSVFFDFFVTDQVTTESGANTQVTCIAADNVVLDEQIKILKDMNIKPVAINVIPDALGNLLFYCVDMPKGKTIALLELGANNSLLNFYRDKMLIFSRDIPVAGEHFTQAMSKGIAITGPDGTSINLSLDDAEKIKRNCGIPLEDEARTDYFTDFGVFRGEKISAILRPILERLVVEVTRTFSYYSKTFRAPAIDELYLTGGSSRLRNIDKFLLYNLTGIKKVEALDTLKVIKGWSDTGVFRQELVVEQAAPHLAAAFGLCFGSGGKINLLPLKEKIEQKMIFLTTLLRIIFPLLLAVVLAIYGVTYGNAYNYKILINKFNYEISRLEPTVQRIREYSDIKAKLDQRKQLLESAKGKQPLWWGMMKELSNITPKDVILDKITTISAAEPKKIRLSGKIFAKYTIVDLALSQYLMILDESPFFDAVQLVSSTQDMYSPIPAANFEIDCQLKY